MTDSRGQIIEKLIRLIENTVPEKTSECPSEETLYTLLKDLDNESRQTPEFKHALSCSYCAAFLKVCLSEKDKTDRIDDFHKRLFPLEREIEFQKIQSLALFRDNQVVDSKQLGVTDMVAFTIREPGFYHIEVDSGQVLWRREVAAEEILLSDDEIDEAMESGLAAATEEDDSVKESFRETAFDGKLVVSLNRRANSGLLKVFVMRSK